MTIIDVSLRPAQVSPRAMRQAWIDNLRVTVIAGVIVMHVASAYVLDIDWYYEERTTSAVTEIGVAATTLPAALFAEYVRRTPQKAELPSTAMGLAITAAVCR